MLQPNFHSTTRPLYGQVAVVTGASRGIGAAIATQLASAGAHIAVHYFSHEDEAEAVVDLCRAMGIHAQKYQADVRKCADIETMFIQIKQDLGAPTILVNNAGRSQFGLLIDTTEEEWDTMMSIHLKGAYLCTKAAIPHMIRMQYGRIINISSIWGIVGASCEVAYSAAKGGLLAFTKALAKELGPSGITVNAIAPGAIQTAMLEHLTDADRQQLIFETPMGRLGTTEDVATVALFLANPQTGFMTGQALSPNGGMIIT